MQNLYEPWVELFDDAQLLVLWFLSVSCLLFIISGVWSWGSKPIQIASFSRGKSTPEL